MSNYSRRNKKIVDFQAARRESLSNKMLEKQFMDKVASETSKRVLAALQRTSIEKIAAVEYPVMPYIIGIVSTMVVPANPNRQYLLIQNNSASNIYFAINKHATASDLFLYSGGGFYEPLRPPKGAIYLLGAATGLNCVICEG